MSIKFKISNPASPGRAAFSLIEILVVVALMTLIIIALMTVFSSTQRAFKASITQTDVMEGSRAAMDLIMQDLRQMTPSGGYSNNAVNLGVIANYAGYTPLLQTLPGSSLPRTNLLNYFFMLGRENRKWTGTGYIVDTTATAPLYPLYRFYAETNIQVNPLELLRLFNQVVTNAQWTNMSHVIDGVVHLTVRAYDTNGFWINDNYTNAQNTLFLSSAWGEAQFYMFSNTVPAAVELQLGVLEDRTLTRAESLPNNLPSAPPNDRRTQYLKEQAGKVHLFRQRVTIPNADPTAYQ